MTEDSNKRPELVIPPRPQIHVAETADGDVEIATASISSNFDGVDFDTIVIPMDDLPAVVAALQAILARGVR